MRVEVAAATDVGRMRPRNEDAYHAGQSVFAVADGMGGHLAGDVASATALLPIKGLDGRVFPDAASAHAALLDAILAANAAVVRKAADQPTLHGMGTTLTATIVEGRRLHVGHVGDSRAYLVRDRQVTQLTRDHTLVAHLIEEGQITKEEAAIHPQRSIVTRAIGVDVDLDVDTLTIDLREGDQVLLCSDGLTGPITDEEILDVLTADQPAEVAVRQLIERANARGGPDNITVVLLRYLEVEPARPANDGRLAAADMSAPVLAGDASALALDGHDAGAPVRPTVIRPDADRAAAEQDWARTLGQLGTMGGKLRGRTAGHQEPRGDRIRRVATITVVVLLLLVVGAAGAWWLLSRAYFVGLDGDRVAIYQGVPASLGPLELSWVTEPTGVTRREVPAWKIPDLEDGIAAADLRDAQRIVANLRALAGEEPSPEASPSPSPGTASPAA